MSHLKQSYSQLSKTAMKRIAAADDEEIDLVEAQSPDKMLVGLGTRVRNLRRHASYTLDELAVRSQVSRAMLSKVERSEKSPTLGIIVRIAKGLNVTLSSLLGSEPDDAEVSIVHAADRVFYRDPVSGFEREVMSPPNVENGVEILLHRIPAGKSSGILPAYTIPTEKFVIVREGDLTVHIGDEEHSVKEGDTMHFKITAPYYFSNHGTTSCAYYVIIIRTAAP